MEGGGSGGEREWWTVRGEGGERSDGGGEGGERSERGGESGGGSDGGESDGGGE